MLGGAVLPTQAAPPARPARKPSKIVWKTRPPQLISVTSHPAETRLAHFIRLLYSGQRLKASNLLSSKVSPAARQALVEKRWLREVPQRTKDVTQVLFLPDIQIRTRKLYKDGVSCYVLPRKPLPKRKRKGYSGYLQVRMRQERDNWWVELQPARHIVSR
jgi:hypothetical protein